MASVNGLPLLEEPLSLVEDLWRLWEPEVLAGFAAARSSRDMSSSGC